MAKNTPKKTMTQFEKTLTTVIALVIAAILALAVFATYGRISENVKQAAIDAETTAIQTGEKAATIRYMASTVGMTAEEYAAQYGVELKDGLSETSEISDMLDHMTLENYYKFNDEGAEEPTDIDELLTKWGAEELGITRETLWSEVETKVSIGKFVGEEEFEQLISQYESFGYDMSTITADMSLKDANEAIEKIISNGPTNVVDVDEDAADTAATDGEEVPAE